MVLKLLKNISNIFIINHDSNPIVPNEKKYLVERPMEPLYPTVLALARHLFRYSTLEITWSRLGLGEESICFHCATATCSALNYPSDQA